MEEKRFTLRMDNDLFEDISELATRNRRSTAKEIECAIAKYVHDIKIDEILNATDVTNMSQESSTLAMKKMRDLNLKYKTYQK